MAVAVAVAVAVTVAAVACSPKINSLVHFYSTFQKSKMLGLKKEQFKLVNANVKPFLDFKPGFEFNVKGKHLADKKSAPAKFR